jgi:RHS repeat-associated protein
MNLRKKKSNEKKDFFSNKSQNELRNSDSSIYSNAFNFASFIYGGVDVRTGQYSVQINLAKVISYYMNGPEYNLTLIHSPLNFGDNNMGFGIGWNLAGSTYDKLNKKFTIASGETFLVDLDIPGREVEFKDKKLNGFIAKNVDGKYHISYKNGTKEILAPLFGSVSIYKPEKSISNTGLEISFKYEHNINGQYCLTSILEDHTELVSITYSSLGVQIKKRTDNGDFITTQLTLRNNQLAFVSLPNAPSLKYSILYETMGESSYITQFDHPTGATEVINYKKQGHKLLQGAPVSDIPYVISHRLRPGNGQPDIVKTYQYSDTNFLGFGSGRNWTDSGDNLYLANNQYRYTGTEFVNDDNNLRTTYTYNNFHLLLSEELNTNGNKKTTTIEYPMRPNQPFSEQPPQFQLPISHTIEYKNKNGTSRPVTNLTTYDEWGNLIEQTDPGLLKTQYTYYSEDGETGCPPDPDGFVRNVKCQTTIPHTSVPAEPEKTITCIYKLIDGLNNHGQFILPITESSYTGLIRSFEYNEDKDQVLDYGKIKTITETLNGKNTIKSFSHQFSEDYLITIEKITGYDNQTFSTSTTLSRWSEKALSTTDKDGVVNSIQYDALDRIIKATTTPNTQYETNKHFEYNIEPNNNCLTITNVKGGKKRIFYDNSGRKIREEEFDSERWRTTQQLKYNGKGQVEQEIVTDWYNNAASTSIVKDYRYNDWEEHYKTTYLDGHIELNEVDPVANTKRTGIQGLGFIEIQYNSSQLEIERRKILAGASQGSYYATAIKTYDGYNRLASESDFMNNTIKFSSDKFDRIYRIEAPEGLSTELTFLPFRPEKLVQQIKAGNVGQEIELGNKTYDGLGRVLSETKNKLTTQYQYNDSKIQYDTLITPKGDKSQINYNKNLRAIEKQTISDITNNYTYDPKSGMALSYSNENAQNSFTYDTMGRLTAQSEAGKQFTIDYSLLGLPHSQTDYFGNTAEITYNSDGKVKTIEYINHSKVVFNYDNYNRIIHFQYISNNGAQLNIDLTFDDFSRETKRIIQLSTGQTITIDQTYDQNDKLVTRIRSSESTEVLRETFSYNQLGSLINYQCEGSAAPKDEYGLTLKFESYSFNETMSLKTITRQFTDGQTNVCEFEYNDLDNPVRATRVTNSLKSIYPEAIDLIYDENGNLKNNTQDCVMAYNSLNQLSSVSGNQSQTNYLYDAGGKLVSVQDDDTDTENTHLWYNADQLVGESNSSQSTVYHHAQYHIVGGVTEKDDNKKLWIVGSDDKGSPVISASDPEASNVVNQFSYTPYGHRSKVQETLPKDTSNDAQDIKVGFNGERLDVKTDLYHLGNGYRAYDPLMMRFYSPDSLSPFDQAGINIFSYCNGDPINYQDPTGHLPNWLNVGLNVVGLVAAIIVTGVAIAGTGGAAGAPLALAWAGVIGGGLGVISGTLGVAAASMTVVDENKGWDRSQTIRNLGIASLSFGAASFAVGIGTGISTGITKLASLSTKINAAEDAVAAATSVGLRADVALITIHSSKASRFSMTANNMKGYAIKESILKGIRTAIGITGKGKIPAPVSVVGLINTSVGVTNLTTGSISEDNADNDASVTANDDNSSPSGPGSKAYSIRHNPTINGGGIDIISKIIQLDNNKTAINLEHIRDLRI